MECDLNEASFGKGVIKAGFRNHFHPVPAAVAKLQASTIRITRWNALLQANDKNPRLSTQVSYRCWNVPVLLSPPIWFSDKTLENEKPTPLGDSRNSMLDAAFKGHNITHLFLSCHNDGGP